MNIHAFISNRRWLFVLLLVLFFAYWTYDCHFRPKYDHTHTRQVNNFGSALTNFADAKGYFPGPTLTDAVAQMEAFERESGQDFRLDWSVYKRNKTVWGGPFVYELKSAGNVAVFRSTGRNRRDNGGRGDDLQRTVNL